MPSHTSVPPTLLISSPDSKPPSSNSSHFPNPVFLLFLLFLTLLFLSLLLIFPLFPPSPPTLPKIAQTFPNVHKFSLCSCPSNIEPVCCQAGPGFLNAQNPCSCSCQRGQPFASGLCPSYMPMPPASDFSAQLENCGCPKEKEEVCCLVDGWYITTGNLCVCECNGGSLILPNRCPW